MNARALSLCLAALSVSLPASEIVPRETLSGPAPAVEESLFDRPLRRKEEPRDAARFWVPSEPEALPSIAGMEKALSQSFVKRYGTGGNKIWVAQALARGEVYMAFIKTRLHEKNMPQELRYLPVIESAFVQNAVSRSGAAGLWQFMQNSMSPWLTATDWLDERFDFWASTDAALAKLQANYSETNDWSLALAAYNSGLGAIRTVVKKYPGKNYWELTALNALKVETANYVPKLLAVFYLAENPRRNGFEDFWPQWVEWAQVPVGRQADLRVLAEIAGLSAEELQKVNAELRYNITPPDPAYALKVRTEAEERLTGAVSQTETPLVRNYIHIIAAGDTIYSLARKYGVPQASIFEANPGIRAAALRIGSRLLIPALK